MTEPLTITIEVACSVDHAFAVWTSKIGTWWPRDHTVSGGPDAVVALEGRVGGRIYEETRDGTVHRWGEVTTWQPPTQLGYLWHLHRDRSDATEVDVHFIADGPDLTRVEIVQRGWEKFGADADAWRSRNYSGWSSVIPYFASAITEGAR